MYYDGVDRNVMVYLIMMPTEMVKMPFLMAALIVMIPILNCNLRCRDSKDGIDQDCDGIDDVDSDGDGILSIMIAMIRMHRYTQVLQMPVTIMGLRLLRKFRLGL